MNDGSDDAFDDTCAWCGAPPRQQCSRDCTGPGQPLRSWPTTWTGTDEAQLTDEERAQEAAEAQAVAEATYERLKREAQVLAAREAEADRQWAAYLATLEAALFSGIHNQISDWVPFTAPDLTPGEGFTGMVTHVQVRNPNGQIVLTHTERQEMEHGQRLPMPTWERPPLDRFVLEAPDA